MFSFLYTCQRLPFPQQEATISKCVLQCRKGQSSAGRQGDIQTYLPVASLGSGVHVQPRHDAVPLPYVPSCDQ